MTDVLGRLTAALADRYVIARELGAGGMATVYLAHDVRHDRPVALKVLRPELASILGAERFLSEIKTTANLQHPHILSLFDSGEADGLVFYVMPYVEGESLRERLARHKQLPVEEALRIAREVADALAYAHARGVIHRDIKPENIMLAGGHALVADFGIALAVSRSEGGTRLTETGMSLGTPHYMSPEQAMGEKDLTPAADVYALGCVLYEMLAGEPPFTGPTAQAIIARVMTEEPRSLTLQRRTVPEHVEAAALGALAKLPADRFATAAEFAAALAGEPARPGLPPRTASRTVVAGPWRRVSAALGLVVLVLAGVTAWAVTRGGAAHAPPVFDEALPEGAAMDFTGQTASTPYGSHVQNLSLSSTGTFVVYLVRQGETTVLWRRSLTDTTAALLPGTSGAGMPRISPDGTRVAFVAGTSVMVVPLAGGQPRRMMDFDGQVTGLDWVSSARLMVVDQEGYRLRWLDTEAGASEGRSIPRCIDGRWMPAERRLLCSYGGVGRIVDPATGAAAIIRSRDAAGGGGAVPGSAFRFVAGGYLMYASSEGDVRAARYDPRSHTIGRSVTVLTGVRLEAIGTAEFDVDSAGTMVYAPGGNAARGRLMRLAPGGTPTPLPVEPGAYQRWDLSRDGRWLATVAQGPGYQELRVHDLRGGQSFVWLRDESVGQPLWSSDGAWMIVEVSDSSGAAILRGSPADATGPDTLFAARDRTGVPVPMDLHDPHHVVALTGFPPVVVRFDPLHVPVRFDTIARNRMFTMTSPDGRHMVFSLEAGSRIIMTSNPPGSWERQIAANAVEPLWLSSAEILYRSGVTWHLARINAATSELVGPATVWGADPRFSDTYGWSNRPDWRGGIIYLQGPEGTSARYLRVIPGWVTEMRAAVDRPGR
jgi:eukaryotic-like serine/threonine-protein kinase